MLWEEENQKGAELMAGTDSESRIVKVYTVANAPTGEGERYVTQDGRVWKRTFGQDNTSTGQVNGRMHGTTIRRKW